MHPQLITSSSNKRSTSWHLLSHPILPWGDPSQNNCLVVREVFFITETRHPSINFEPNLALFILQRYSQTALLDENREDTIECSSTRYTKNKVDSDKEKCISSPWYDWAFIRFEDDQGNLDDYPWYIVSCIQQHPHKEMSYNLIIASPILQSALSPVVVSPYCSLSGPLTENSM